MNKSVGEIAALVGGTVLGDQTLQITGVSGIKQASEGDLTFLANPLYLPYMETTHATAVLVPPDISESHKTLIQVANPYRALVTLLQNYQPIEVRHPQGVHPTAIIGKNVKLGEKAGIDAHVYIGDDCEIGDGAVLHAGTYVGHSSSIGADTIIYPNVTIREGVKIGAKCIVHSGAVLGSDGFGFSSDGSGHYKIPQIGTVIIGDDVEIGAGTAIDRATFGRTVVGRGTKIDNLVQIGHNVEIGRHCIIAGTAAIAGSTTIGNHVIIAGGAKIIGHVEIGDGAQIGGLAGVTRSVAPGQKVSGFPAQDHMLQKRTWVAMKELPPLQRRIKELERRIQQLEDQQHGKAAHHP
ncbi:MAG: UDP-3-O-(3-hydroxymyristoyl)glucosamine N-acyltransferase [Candidatus Hydrogenedentes bacterium]|nr:UDP-3-O-(3-hydroxymyristoyl)glucosamine N-acyltransferase [Candidatus Hydrogenedentota bacterium]